MKNAINWFDIPVTDYERAKKFYAIVLDGEIRDVPMEDNMKYGVLPFEPENNGIGGALLQYEHAIPSEQGSTVYLNGGDDLSIPLARVEKNGGQIMMPKTKIGENGFMAIFKDTEGNKVAFHSMN